MKLTERHKLELFAIFVQDLAFGNTPHQSSPESLKYRNALLQEILKYQDADDFDEMCEFNQNSEIPHSEGVSCDLKDKDNSQAIR